MTPTPALIDGIDFTQFPYIDSMNWMMREYVRMVSKHAELIAMQREARPRSRRARRAA